jgi:hypothetical protein
MRVKEVSRRRPPYTGAATVVRPFRACDFFLLRTQGVALG